MSAVREVLIQTDSLTTQMRGFLCARYWLPETDFPLCGDIFHALGISGDDCHDFMDNFSLEFKVDLTEYIWPNYHLSESEAQDVRSVLRPLMRLAGLKTQPLNRDLRPISIDHLLHVAELGHWVDPTADSTAEHVGISRNFSRFGAKLRAGGVPKRQPL